MDKIDRFLYERQVDVQELSDRESLQQYLGQASSRTSQTTTKAIAGLNRYRILGGAWENLSLIDSKGVAVLTTDDAASAKALQTQPQFKAAYQKALTGETNYTDVFAEKVEDSPIMLFMAPVRDTSSQEQPIAGVVVGELAWQSTLEILRSIQHSQASLLNKNGIAIGENTDLSGQDILQESHANTLAFKNAQSSTQGTDVLPSIDKPKDPNKKQPGFVTSYVQEGGYLDYNGNHWVLILQSPTSEAFAPVAQLTKSLIITFLVILLFSVAIFLLLLDRQIKRPVSQLLEAVTRLAKGDFSSRIDLKTKDELGDLAQAFNDMADKLASAYQSLKSATVIAQKERSILQTILDNLPVGVFVAKAPDGKPIMMNKVGMQLLGIKSWTNAHQPQTELYEIFQEDGSRYPDEKLPLYISLNTGKPSIKDDLMVKRSDGSTGLLRAISVPIIDTEGKTDSAVVVFEDITKERELERSREEFFSIASHELRTPLTAIRGNASAIKDYLWGDIKSDDAKDMINDMYESAIRLIDIVNDFLDTSRLEQKRMKFTFTSIDLAEIAHSVIKEYQAAGSQQKTLLEVREPEHALPLILADSNRTKQILINLVGNALKFTNEGKVTISFEIEGKTIKTFVQDTGQGMGQDAQKRLFKKFEQSGDTVLTRDSVRGTGLGLYISKLIVEQMHGNITLESSQVGVGTVFSFSLPIVPAEGKIVPPQTPQP
jgi:signal transduction histidine kinase